MSKYMIKVGIIGGTGINDPTKVFEAYSEIPREHAKNEFGLPSSNLYLGRIGGLEVVILSRHGTNHSIQPSLVNYRANIEALRLAGCTHILACTACGSLSENIYRGQLVIPDGFIDRTVHRIGTFYDGSSPTYPGVCHVPMEPAFDPHMSRIIENAANNVGIPIQKGGTIVTIEGPRYSSKAESKLYASWGGHLINMSTCPEVCLAKEAGLLYASITMATDYDSWRDSDEDVRAADVIEIFKTNLHNMTKIVVETVHLIRQEDWDHTIDDLRSLIRSSNITMNR